MIPPCPAASGLPSNTFGIVTGGNTFGNIIIPPIMPPKPGVAPNSLAALIPT